MVDEEKIYHLSLYQHWLTEYRKYRIRELYGYTFDQFIARPRAEIKLLCSAAHDDNVQALSQTNKLDNLLNAHLNR